MTDTEESPSRPGKGSALLFGVGAAVAIVVAAAAVAFQLGGPRVDEAAAKTRLGELGALASMDAQRAHVGSLTLSTVKDPAAVDEVLQIASTLGALTSLNVNGVPLSPEQAARIGTIGSLESLSVKGTGLDDAAVDRLAGLNAVQALHLNRNPVTNSTLPALARMASLRVLDLSNTEVTDPHALAEAEELEWLTLRDLTLADGSLATLAGAPNLSRLTLQGATYEASDLEELRNRNPALSIDE